MPAPKAIITGRLVAHTSRDYSPFTDRQGEKRPGGTTRAVFLVVDQDEPPTEVRFSQDDDGVSLFGHICDEYGWGDEVSVECRVYSNGPRAVALVDDGAAAA